MSTSTDSNEPLCLNLATELDVDIVFGSESGVEPKISQLSVDLKNNYNNIACQIESHISALFLL